MKVGDLIWDEQYGYGIITELWDDGVIVHFYETCHTAFLGEKLYDSVEVISESR